MPTTSLTRSSVTLTGETGELGRLPSRLVFSSGTPFLLSLLKRLMLSYNYTGRARDRDTGINIYL